MTKERWRSWWLDSINELTSIELQKKSWLDKENTNPHWSFIEFISCYFDELSIDDNYEKEITEGWISKEEYNAIKDWHELLNKYNPPKNENYNHEAILEDENWKQVVKKGIKAKEKLKKILSEKEASILVREINYLDLNKTKEK